MRRFKEFELSAMRLEEQQKYMQKKERDREDMQSVHTQRLKKLQDRERDTLERCKFKMNELEKANYEHRQQVLRDMELFKQKEKDFKQIFSGTFWLSEEAKTLGLIDGISSESAFLKKKFGEKVKIKKIKQPKSLKQKLGLGISSYATEELVSKAKEELMFNKYGL